MPRYDYECDGVCESLFEITASIHDGPPTDLTCACGGNLVRIFSMPHVGGAALVTRNPSLAEHEAFSHSQEENRDAYIRLRKDGKQPRSVMQSADIERFAQSDFEVESGYRLSSAKVGKKYDETQKFLKGGGLLPIGSSKKSKPL